MTVKDKDPRYRALVFGHRVRDLRERRGYTQEVLANRARTTRETIARIETGKHQDTGIDLAARIAIALGATLDWLTGISSENGK